MRLPTGSVGLPSCTTRKACNNIEAAASAHVRLLRSY